MKIVVTLVDCSGAVCAGGGVERESAIIEIPDDSLPALVKKYKKDRRWASEGPNRYTYQSLEFSVLNNSKEVEDAR